MNTDRERISKSEEEVEARLLMEKARAMSEQAVAHHSGSYMRKAS